MKQTLTNPIILAKEMLQLEKYFDEKQLPSGDQITLLTHYINKLLFTSTRNLIIKTVCNERYTEMTDQPKPVSDCKLNYYYKHGTPTGKSSQGEFSCPYYFRNRTCKGCSQYKWQKWT